MTNLLRPHSPAVKTSGFDPEGSGSNPDVAATPITDSLRAGAAKAGMSMEEYWRYIICVATIEIDP